MTEKELKFKLPDERSYQAMESLLGRCEKEKVQENHYFDTPDGSLTAGTAVLRLRVEGARKTLTFKIGQKVEGGYFEALEFECPVVSDRPEAWEDTDPIRQFRRHFGAAPVEKIGVSRNLRRVFALNNGDRAELDRTELPGGRIDYELEVETEDPETVTGLVSALLEQASIPLEWQTQTKFARFLECLGRG